MNRFRAAAAASLVAIASLIATAAAPASPWSEPTQVFPGEQGYPRIAGLPDGGDVAILQGRPMRASLRHPGGAFGPATVITRHPALMNLATGSSGHVALITWGPGDAEHDGLVLFTPGSGWAPPERLPDASGGPARFGADGNLRIATSYGVVTRAADGTFGQTQAYPAGTDMYARGFGIAPDGTVTAVWRSSVQGAEVRSASAPPGGEFGASTTIATNMYSSFGEVKVLQDARGDMLAVWQGGPKFSYTPPGYAGALFTSYRPAGGSWGPPQRIPGDPADETDWRWDAAMNGRGDAVVAWGGESRLLMSYRAAGGSFEPVTVGPENGCCGDIKTAIAPDGRAIVVDVSLRPDGPVDDFGLESFDHPAGGSFQAPERVAKAHSPDGPDVAAVPSGEAHLIWAQSSNTGLTKGVWFVTRRIQASAPPNAGPPAVTKLQLHTPPKPGTTSKERTALSYRLSRRARVRLRVWRVPKQGPARLVTTVRAAMPGGMNRSPLSRDATRRLAAAGRYRATIVAFDGRGRKSKPRWLEFKGGS